MLPIDKCNCDSLSSGSSERVTSPPLSRVMTVDETAATQESRLEKDQPFVSGRLSYPNDQITERVKYRITI